MDSNNSPHSGHRLRLKKRYIENGISSLFDHEKLELLLFYPFTRTNTNETAHALLKKFGSISGVLEAPHSELITVKGINDAVAAFITGINAVIKRIEASENERSFMNDSVVIKEYIKNQFSGETASVCMIICMSESFELLGNVRFKAEWLCSGKLSMRSLWEDIMQYSACRILLAINCSGLLPIMDAQEAETLRRIAAVLGPVGIKLDDCFLCKGDLCISMCESGGAILLK